MAIQKTSDEVKEKIKRASAHGLPTRPSERGMKPDEIRRFFYEPIIGDNNSLLSELSRIVDEANAAIEARVPAMKETGYFIRVYVQLEDGSIALMPLIVNPQVNEGITIATRDDTGNLRINEASPPSEWDHLIHKGYVDEGFLPKMQIIQEQRKPESEENDGVIEFAEAYDRAYIRRRDGKDSFIPFTLEAKRVDSIWERGESTPTIPLRHDYGQIEVAEPLYDDDAVPYSMVKELDSKVKEATSIAKGAQKAISFADYKTLINAVKKWGVGEYPIGQSIYIVTRDVPDLWISGEEELLSDWQDYPYNTDADFIADLRKNGKVYVGRYYISELETQKVDLTNHYDKDEIDAMIGDISTALDEILALQAYYTGDTFEELHEYAQNVIGGGES